MAFDGRSGVPARGKLEGDRPAGAQVIQWGCHGAPNQQWQATAAGMHFSCQARLRWRSISLPPVDELLGAALHVAR